MNGDPVDALYTRTGSPVAIRHPRIETIHTHGTGCFLSSAIASFLSNGFELEESVRIAIAHLTSALYTPVSIGKGRGYPAPVRGISTRMRRENRVSGIYFVTSDEFGCSHEESALAALAGGVKVIQFRAKNMDTAQMIRVASKIHAQCKESGAVFIVNDRVDVALASGADGAHVGADDMAASKAREIMGPDAIIGASVATLDDAALAAPYVSHFGVGPVFGTSTKLDAGAAIGLERVSEIKKAFPNIPLIAIGGIGAEQIAPVKHAGADSAAVISAIAGASDRAQAARNLVKLWGEGQH
jgi:thiamine-phosphate pyrophosphorylase